jgi:tetratricopeptide (TPR) repeat protein
MIPTQTAWTVIFSRNATSWGSYHYKMAEDALRVTVTPQAAEHGEWLAYEVSDLTDTSAVLSLHWEKLRVPVGLKFDTPSIVVAYARDTFLRGTAGFNWQGFNQAAQYCLRKNIQLDQALRWADEAISRQENFTTLRTKAALLEKMGKEADAKRLNDRSLTLATEADINTLGYSYLTGGNITEAIATFEKNVKSYPTSWNVYDSLAEAQEKAGNRKAALANYEKALKLVTDEQNRKRLTDTITTLKAR